MAKITDEQLKKLQLKQKDVNTLINSIGIAESQKHAMLHQLGDVNSEVEELKKQLEQEYGSISIDMQTGEYTIIEEEVKEKESQD